MGAAAAEVAAPVEIRLGDLAALGAGALNERHRGHDLPGLAVAALGHVELEPRLLHRVQLLADGRAEPLDRRDLVARLDLRYRHRTGVERLAVDVAPARPSDPAA